MAYDADQTLYWSAERFTLKNIVTSFYRNVIMRVTNIHFNFSKFINVCVCISTNQLINHTSI